MEKNVNKPTVGIITMHKVLNFGSALQTYALQEAVEQLGFRVEIIDYLYPNAEHHLYWELPSFQNQPVPLNVRIKNKLFHFLKLVRNKKKVSVEDSFQSFYQNFLHLTHKYPTRYWLGKQAPTFDIYMTGSDQVWNPKFIGYDTSFMLSFVQDSRPKVSYASSFAVDALPSQYEDSYRHELGKYSHISVREQSGVNIIRKLLNREAKVTCDPTMLLDKKSWMKVISTSNFEIGEPYMLIYVLDYAYDPYPYVFDVIRKIHKEMGLKMVILHGRIDSYMKNNQAIYMDSAGPVDFLRLFVSASFVITTSFHGTAFALNFEIPFVALVKDKDNSDSRIYNLLKKVQAEDHALVCNFPLDNQVIPYGNLDDNINCNLAKFREQSFEYLKDALLTNLNSK